MVERVYFIIYIYLEIKSQFNSYFRACFFPRQYKLILRFQVGFHQQQQLFIFLFCVNVLSFKWLSIFTEYMSSVLSSNSQVDLQESLEDLRRHVLSAITMQQFNLDRRQTCERLVSRAPYACSGDYSVSSTTSEKICPSKMRRAELEPLYTGKCYDNHILLYFSLASTFSL